MDPGFRQGDIGFVVKPDNNTYRRRLIVPAEDAGVRIDRWLATQCSDLSRSRIQALIADGQVKVGGAVIERSALELRPDDQIEIIIPHAAPAVPLAQAIDLDVVFEDEHLIVVNKAAGMVVHPGAGNPDKTLVNALLAHCGDSLKGIGGVLRPGIVHRIDKNTSGLLVAAKTDAAHAGLAEQLAAHTMQRVYDAIVWGKPKPPSGTIRGFIGRSPNNRKKMALLKSGGRDSQTTFKTVEAFHREAAYIECQLKTGRTHQIRVHMASIAHPLIGDPTYGTAPAKYLKALDPAAAKTAKDFPRQALHARSLGFVHPVTEDELHFERDMPEDMAALLDALRKG